MATHNQSYLRAWVMQRAALDPRRTVSLAWIRIVDQQSCHLSRHCFRARSEALRVRVLLGAASLALRAAMPDRASHYLRLALQTSEIHGWRRPYGEIAAAIMPVLEAERRRITSRGEQVVELLDYLRRQPVYRSSNCPIRSPSGSWRSCSICQLRWTSASFARHCSSPEHAEDTLALDVSEVGVQTRREAVLQAERLGIL